MRPNQPAGRNLRTLLGVALTGLACVVGLAAPVLFSDPPISLEVETAAVQLILTRPALLEWRPVHSLFVLDVESISPVDTGLPPLTLSGAVRFASVDYAAPASLTMAARQLPAGTLLSVQSGDVPGEWDMHLDSDGSRGDLPRFRISSDQPITLATNTERHVPAVPAAFDISPRGRRLRLVFPVESQQVLAMATVSRIAFTAFDGARADEIDWRRAVPRPVSGTIRFPEMREASRSIGGGQPSTLLLDRAAGVVSDVRLTGRGVALRFEGTARTVVEGSTPIAPALPDRLRASTTARLLLGAVGVVAAIAAAIKAVTELAEAQRSRSTPEKGQRRRR